MSQPALDKKLDDLYKLIDGIETAMLTTRTREGRLVSRAMRTQQRSSGTDLWFVTSIESPKVEELAFDPQVNVSYYRDRTREWVSVSGRAILTQDRDLIHGLYKPDWRAWFEDQGGKFDGSADDPRLALILVEAESVMYFKKDKPMPIVLFEVAKGMITGKRPDVGEERELDANEIRAAARRSQAGEGDLRA